MYCIRVESLGNARLSRCFSSIKTYLRTRDRRGNHTLARFVDSARVYSLEGGAHIERHPIGRVNVKAQLGLGVDLVYWDGEKTQRNISVGDWRTEMRSDSVNQHTILPTRATAARKLRVDAVAWNDQRRWEVGPTL
jgi:hypothetical protein